MPAFRRLIKRYAKDFLRKREGNRGVWIEVDENNPERYFMRSSWVDRATMDSAFEHEKSKAFRMELGGFLQERHVIWQATSLDSEMSSIPIPEDANVYIRLAKLVVSPSYKDMIMEGHAQFSKKLLTLGKGCFKFSLYANEQDPNTLYFESFWESAKHMQEGGESDPLVELRENLVPFLQERLKVWSLKVIEEDPSYPIVLTS